jgi:hypothetical protein
MLNRAPQCKQNRASPGFSSRHRRHRTGDHPLAIQLPAITDREPPTSTRATPLAAPNGRKPNRGTDLNRHNQDIPGL